MHNLHYEKFRDGTVKCIEEEIPFDVPNGWEWCRLSNICLILNGDRGQNYPAKSKLHSEGIPFVSASNIIDGEVSTEGLLYLSDEQYDLLGAGKLELNDIVFCIRGSLGKCGYFTMEKGAIASSLVIVRAISNKEYLNGYIFNYLNSLFAYDEIKKYDNGSAQPNLAAKDFQNFLVPLPANEEIGRISDKCEILLMNENNISVAAEELQDCISNTKSKILDLAIRGKLVPQNPNDEPASILLKRIREEKESLIKQGKIKHDKKESIIYKGDDNSYLEKFCSSTVVDITEEIPFDLPQGWRWCRLKEIVQIINGDRGSNYPAKNKLHDNGIPFVSASNIDDGIVSHESGMKYMSQEQYSLLRAGLLQYNDIVYCIRGSLGKCGIFPYEHGAIASSLVIVRPFVKASSITDYVMIYLNSALAFSEIKKYDNGTAQPNLAAKDFENFLIPLPPLNMINMIVKKYNQLMAEVSLICEAI